MKKLNVKDVLIPTVALLVICFIATALLAFTNSITVEKIALNAVETENASRNVVLPDGASYSEVTKAENGVTYCTGYDKIGNEIGYVFTAGAKGYGGTVSVMVGLDKEGTVTGIEILSHSETPGLGANAVKDDFKGRFTGKSGILTVDKVSNDGQNIQAITAATITSKAVVSAVNTIIETYTQIMTGGGTNG
ncbi:MAG: RnfABCDGE type electron transport complex subunit G [Clostridia bacterium]|nr:RnfABCDGE type electron transport complex subunit G [Clostridia bacterium]